MNKGANDVKRMATLAGLVSAIALSAPSYAAATYTGTFKGIVTSGGASDPSDGPADVTGQIVDIFFKISFFAATEWDPSYYLGYGSVGNNDFSIFSEVTDPPFSAAQLATFSGNERAGAVSFSYNGQDDSSHIFSLSYNGARMTDGRVNGSGGGNESYNDSYFGLPDRFVDADFKILSGNVQITGAPPVPEPATWAMMVIGFGAVGATMRGRRKARSAYNPALA